MTASHASTSDGPSKNNSSNSSAPGRPMLADTFALAFWLPPQARAGALAPWLALLEPDRGPGEGLLANAQGADTRPAAAGGDPATHAAAWAQQVLALAQALMHVLRIPVFDPIALVECQPHPQNLPNPPHALDRLGPLDLLHPAPPQPPVAEPSQPRWNAVCSMPDLSLVAPQVCEGLIAVAFKLARWACAANPEAPGDRAEFFQAIERDVVQAFAHARRGGKSTFEVLRVAHRTGVPFLLLPGSIFQLGWGAHARRIDRSTTDRDSAMAVRLTQDKRLTAQLLRQAGLPAPKHAPAETLEQARAVAERLGYPVVVKPADMERGEGVVVDVGPQQLEAAFAHAQACSAGRQVLVEQQVPGVCHRIFVVAGLLLYAVRRLPMGVYADGHRTIRALVDAECALQQARPPWKRSGIRPLDEPALHMLRRQGWGPDAVPAAGKFVGLRRIESTAWGGVDEDVTATIHPDNVRAAVAASQLMGLEVAGVDMICRNIAQPWHASGAVINEVNYAPLLGGGEISRRHIGEYLARLLPQGGAIRVHGYLGDGAGGWESAQRHWLQLRASGVQAWLAGPQATLGPDGQPWAMAAGNLAARVRALLMCSQVQALVVAAPTLAALGPGARRWPWATLQGGLPLC